MGQTIFPEGTNMEGKYRRVDNGIYEYPQHLVEYYADIELPNHPEGAGKG